MNALERRIYEIGKMVVTISNLQYQIKKEHNLSGEKKMKRGQGRSQSFSWRLILLILLAGITACQGDILTPPREATLTARTAVPPTATLPPIILEAPTPTAVSGSSGTPIPLLQPDDTPQTITVWVNETSADHADILQLMADEFQQTYAINVELRLVTPALLPELVTTAVVSDTYDLPDILIHPVEYTAGWTERGILDAAAADTIIDEIGRETFNSAALDLVTYQDTTAVLPSDGYQKLLIYRADWFTEQDLPPPDNYEALMAAAAALYDRENLISGLVIPTESNLVTTQQAFEQLAAANGCQLIDQKGEVLLLDSVCQQALDFYFNIIHNYSPIGVQTDTSMLNAYLSGRTGMILASPHILPQLAGLDPEALPTCPKCSSDNSYLAQNSGVITHITGDSPQAIPANFSNLTALGITPEANTEAAAAFANYWFNEGYEKWLTVESERKVPLRLGADADQRQFIDAWGTQPLSSSEDSLTDIYGADLVTKLREETAVSNRWGISQGQAILITDIYENLTLSVVLQEMLSGYFNSEDTLNEAYVRILDLIPNYQYHHIELTPTVEQ